MATRKPADVVAALPAKVILDADFVCWTKVHGTDLTWQFYANQSVRDPQAIRVLLDNAAPLKD